MKANCRFIINILSETTILDFCTLRRDFRIVQSRLKKKLGWKKRDLKTPWLGLKRRKSHFRGLEWKISGWGCPRTLLQETAFGGPNIESPSVKSWIRPRGGFRFWLIVFVKKDFGFVVHSGLRIFHFLAFGFRFSSKIPAGFLIFVSDVVFGFSYLGSGLFSVCVRRSNGRETKKCSTGGFLCNWSHVGQRYRPLVTNWFNVLISTETRELVGKWTC